MSKFQVSANGQVFGIYECETEQGARDACALDAGYKSEADMAKQLGASSELEVELVDVRTVEVKEPSAVNSTESIDPSLVGATGGAEPTSRVLEGSQDHGYAEEWAEPAAMPDGRKCSRIYLFTESEILNNDGEPLEAENYPWDDEHVARILLAD